MQLTKYTHACVRLVVDGTTLVIDPGIWTEPEALDGADAILVTHEHADHADLARLAGVTVPVFVPDGADVGDLQAVRVGRGERFTAAGVPVEAIGDRHALIFEDLPNCPNFGYLVGDGLAYHPGDALALPDRPVDTLLVPMAGPWLKVGEALAFALAVRPTRAFGIHDAALNERGLGVNGWFSEEIGDRYRWLAPGESA